VGGLNRRLKGDETIKLTVSKLLPASSDEAFDMWLNPQSIRRWMCPGDSTVSYVEVQPVVGGSFRIDMRSPDDRVMVHTGTYLDIQRPSRLVFTWNSPALEQGSQVTVTFADHPDGCLLELHHELLPDQQSVDNHRAGWSDILEHLRQSPTGSVAP
jgi:uncharacterized protein YndB with AHSA1/START domain